MTTIAVLVILILCIAGMHCEQCAERPPPTEDMCCKININVQKTECLKRVYEQLRLYFQLHDKESFVKTHDMCLSNCIFNDTNIITSDNKMNPVELKNIMEKWLPESTKTIEMCTELVGNAKSHGPRESSMIIDTPFSNCNMAAEKFFFCLQNHIIIACPDSLWNNVSECNNLRAYLKKCPFEKRGYNKQ